MEGAENGEADVLRLAPHQMLAAFPGLNVCAPMVRYSKLAFRTLVSRYETHITTTPMMLAKEFSRTEAARNSEFSTNEYERGVHRLLTDAAHSESGESAQRLLAGTNPKLQMMGSEGEAGREEAANARKIRTNQYKVRGALVSQFASSEPKALADATELIAKYVDGVDLNCGCPQSWAYEEQLGSYLLRQPETVRDMVRAVKARLGESFCISVKIRIDPDLALTDTLVRNALHAGASILSIHGRTRWQASASHPVDLDGIKFAVEAANSCGLRTSWGSQGGAASRFADGGSGGNVPCVANGDVWTLQDAMDYRAHTGAKGAMAARGLLANPALFAGYEQTPPEAVPLFHTLAHSWGLHTALIHRHLAYMLEASFPSRAEEIYFNSLSGSAAITDWLAENGYLQASPALKADTLADMFAYCQPSKISPVARNSLAQWDLASTIAGLGLVSP